VKSGQTVTRWSIRAVSCEGLEEDTKKAKSDPL